MSTSHDRSSLYVAVASAVIALIALGYSFYQGKLQKDNFQISVQPYVTVVPTIDSGKNQYGYYIYNSGVGRGYIDRVEYYYDGKRVPGNNIAPLRTVVKLLGFDENCFSYGNPRANDSISLDEMNTLLTISSAAGANCKNTIENFHKAFAGGQSRFTLKIWYRSLYDIHFVYDSADNSQHKL